MKSILRLVRFGNLLIIALTMYLIRYFLIGKMLDLNGLWLGLSDPDFLLLTLSVVFIAAAGYIINDYFDTSADEINKPDKVIIGRRISRKAAFNIYMVLNVLGILIGFYLAYKVNVIQLGFINLLSVGLLWFYTTSYKRRLLIGNLVVATLTAMVPLTAGLFEPYRHYTSFSFVVIYALFAFVMNLIREIVKDMQDLEGDLADGCRTLPIVLGIPASRVIAIFLGIVVLAFLAFIEYNQYVTKDPLSFWYFTLAISLPLLVFIVQLARARDSSAFGEASSTAKVVMVTGILSTVIFYLSIS